jgi:hypothetical protein
MKALRLFLPLTVLLSLATGATVRAQSVSALRGDRHEVTVHERLRLRFDGERSGAVARGAWPGEFDWFLVRVAGTQRNLEDLAAADPEADSFDLLLSESGVTLVAADRKPRIEEVTPRELRAFLRSRLGPKTLPAASLGSKDEPALRVRRLESSKLLVRVLGDEGWLPNSATAQSKTGQRVEIRPLGDPTSVKVRTDMPLRIYVPNPRKVGTKVIARHLESGKRQTFLTDREGTGHFTVNAPGVWLVEVHHARRLVDDPEADWELHTATLTFEVPSWDPRELEEQKR